MKQNAETHTAQSDSCLTLVLLVLSVLFSCKKSLKKGVITICISKKNRQHNGQKKKYKGANNHP